MIFGSPDEVVIALDQSAIDINAFIKVRIDGKTYDTTAGRVILYRILPKELGFDSINDVLEKKKITKLVEEIYNKCGNFATFNFLDNLKQLGFTYSTKAGFSICVDDLIIPKEKDEIIEAAMKRVMQIEESYKEGALTPGERYNQIIEIWSNANDEITNRLMKTIENQGGDKSQTDKRKRFYNPIYVMAHSGARGSKAQISQLAGMRGLMAKPSGEIIETPITAT